MNLERLGWNPFFADRFGPYAEQGFIPARVAVGHRGHYEIWVAAEVYCSEVSGRFHHEAQSPADFPAVGDWVAVEPLPSEKKAIIHAVLPRRTSFSRTAPGGRGEQQIVAANVDYTLIVTALSAPVNLRRIERYLVLAWDSGATPLVVLTKADLCGNIPEAVAETKTVAQGVNVFLVSSVDGTGIDDLRNACPAGATVVLLGPSGVGKSSLINSWLGQESLRVQPVRESDQKGRHTTTHRQMLLMPSGFVVIDTPGMRELQLWEGETGVAETFDDIGRWAAHCRFSDCLHEGEPGCAVRAAIDRGDMDPARLASHHKLLREAAHAVRQSDKRAMSTLRRSHRTINRSLRQFKKFSA